MKGTTHDPGAGSEPEPGQEHEAARPSMETVEFSGHRFSIRVSSRRAGATLFVDEIGVTIRSDRELADLASALQEAIDWRAARSQDASSRPDVGPSQRRPTFDVEPDRIWGGSSPEDMPKALTELTTQNGEEDVRGSEANIVRPARKGEVVRLDAIGAEKARGGAASAPSPRQSGRGSKRHQSGVPATDSPNRGGTS
jgi:hypothetical protein